MPRIAKQILGSAKKAGWGVTWTVLPKDSSAKLAKGVLP